MPVRVQNWDTELFRWARGMAGRSFVWGDTDCGSLVRGAVSIMYAGAITFDDVRYASRDEAMQVHEATGGVEAVLRASGAVEVPIAFLQQGDIVIESEPDENGLPSAGICVGSTILVSNVRAGVGFAPIPVNAVVLRYPNG